MANRPLQGRRREAFTRPRKAIPFVVSIVALAAACAPGPSARPGPRPVEASPCARAFVFVDHGRPAATIVIPEGAGETERRGAGSPGAAVLKKSGGGLPGRAAPG